jgi:hypothetical protein
MKQILMHKKDAGWQLRAALEKNLDERCTQAGDALMRLKELNWQ